MARQSDMIMKENHVYIPKFYALSYSSKDGSDDSYDEVIYYDGGELDEESTHIYDGGGVDGYGD